MRPGIDIFYRMAELSVNEMMVRVAMVKRGHEDARYPGMQLLILYLKIFTHFIF